MGTAALRYAKGQTRFISTKELEGLDDVSLVSQYIAGESRAFDVLFHRYRTRLLNFINRTIGDRERSEDLVQEAFIRVHRHIARFDRAKKFSTWVYTIAGNLAKNELRNRGRNPIVLFQAMGTDHDDEERPLEFEDPESRPDDLFEQRQLREMIDGAVAQLPAHHQKVFVMRELEGRSYEEIAALTDCNLGTVKSRLNRARSAFAEVIEPAVR
jgi:RNA polymerase sigma-70 factor (ECF subfamily)